MRVASKLRAVLLSASVVCCTTKAVDPGGDRCALFTERMGVELDVRTGAPLRFVDPKAGFNLVDGRASHGLWEIYLEGGKRIKPDQAGVWSWKSGSADEPTAVLRWSDFPGQDGLAVEATVRFDRAEPVTYWKMKVTGPAARQIQRTIFPRIAGLARQPGEVLAVPMWLGQMARSPRDLLWSGGKERRIEWAYPGLWSVQCATLYGERAGLYVACNDTAAFRKQLAFFSDASGTVGCEVAHLPEQTNPVTDGWEQPYEVVLGSIQGDWVTAAERYRSWATNQVWARESRLARGLVPRWVLDTGLWVWNRGRSDQVLEPAMALRKQLKMPVSVFWHWWHGCSYDSGFPEYLPPREGEDSFKRAVAQARKRSIRPLVYMNQRLWGMTTKSWTDEGAERWAVKGVDGRVHPEVYNTFTKAPCASMCMGTEFWRTKYAGLAVEAVDSLGVSGIYMDQACTSLACYDGTHLHPRGGGTYWVRGFQSMAHNIRAQARDDELCLSGEGCGEPWLPYLDVMLSLQVSQERYQAKDGWEPIPFFHAVYHAYCISYGNYSSLTMPPYDELWPAEFAPPEPLKLLDRKFSGQFRLEQARAFVWGQQPTVANFMPLHLRERRAEMDYAIRLAKLRSRYRKFLQDGTFLAPPELEAAGAVMDFSRLSIYAGQQGGLKTFQQYYPSAIAGAWKNGEGEVGLALANVSEEPLEVNLAIDTQRYGIAAGAKMTSDDGSRSRVLGRLQPGVNRVPLSLPGAGACVLTFR